MFFFQNLNLNNTLGLSYVGLGWVAIFICLILCTELVSVKC